MDHDEETRTYLKADPRVAPNVSDDPVDGPIDLDILDPAKLIAPAEHARLDAWLRSAIASLGASGEVRVRLVPDAEMSDAHERYSGIAGTTDVLTFDMRSHHDQPSAHLADPLDVDIWACVDEADRQARLRGHSRDRELLLYCLHGVLHCLGYDDHDDDAFHRMHAEEDRILETIGVGRTFAAPHASTSGSIAPAGDAHR